MYNFLLINIYYYYYYYYYYYIIIIIRVYALTWMNEKAQLIKSFTQCDCEGKNHI